ncbi:uncharacterized protein CTHT_0067820 [Thermochaetoides thermophila DSM 1495]|uniref:Cytochrome c oxidase subunit 7 n=1 Tax=Chaetomium thermophilum (strain DSM 1495 / CBS 144.50 / IMI 039719) TaxID=759272 RepID=G0SGW6_CHATD|nr:hypothetical protein CTHT_0067820 [Thermochaetoides thermophila DSM 1495]EGS17455.1 hypothetical protein CTHT_0067820 [Thermochaetoides thermophila DSM 1495]
MAFINRENRVPELQRYYQAAYKNHVRLWQINPRSKYYLTPYYIILWGTTAATFYAMGRRIFGHNTWFSD